MLYEVAFSTKGAGSSGLKEIGSVTLNGKEVDGQFFENVQTIIKQRKSVHPTVDKWARAPAHELNKGNLGLTIMIYNAERHPYTGNIERYGDAVYWNQS